MRSRIETYQKTYASRQPLGNPSKAPDNPEEPRRRGQVSMMCYGNTIYVNPGLRWNRSDSPFGRTGTSSKSRDSYKIGATRNSSEHKRNANSS